MVLRRTQHRLLVMVSRWGFFVPFAWILRSPDGIVAQSGTSSSSYPGCSGYVPFINDSVCDELNNNGDCGYDGGDCCSCTCVDSLTKVCGYDADFNCTDPNVPDDCGETPSPAVAFGFPNCTGYMWDLGDEFCDDDLNNEECGYDGGDCCRCTCRSTGYDYCGYYGYDCLDPDAPTDCESASPAPSPAATLGYPDCTMNMYLFQNGYCNSDLNNEDCGYDGGDCCRCTCEDGIYYTCGYSGYNCLDPNADTDCPSPSPTPTPAASLGYPDCTEDMSILYDGNCDLELNNEECGYDGGDCCRCTCEDGMDYDCGNNGFDCEDPAAPTYCPVPGSTPTPAAGLGYPDCTGDMSDLQNGYCDWNLNKEDCGYDGGDCCECSCTGDFGDYECGENGYNCLYPDPCLSVDGDDEGHSSEKSSLSITVAAIIFIACLCVICVGFFVILHVRVKRRAQTATTTHTVPLSPPPAFETIARARHLAPTRTTNNLVGEQPRFAMPWGGKVPTGYSYQVAGLRDYTQPSAPSKPSQPEAVDARARGVSSSIPWWQRLERSITFRSAPILEDGAFERSTNNVEVGHRSNTDIVDAERIWLAVAESRRVQTISEAIFREEICRSQSGAYAVITGTGESPSDIADGGNAEEKVPISADEIDNDQEAGSGSEWGSDGEGGMEEEGPPDNGELHVEGNQHPGTVTNDSESDEHKEIIGPKGTAQEDEQEDAYSTSHADVQVKSSNNDGREVMASSDTHQAEISADSPTNPTKETVEVDDGLKDDDVDPHPILSAEENELEGAARAEAIIPARRTESDASNKEDNIEGPISPTNLASEKFDALDGLKDDDVDPHPILSAEENEPGGVARTEDVIPASKTESGAYEKVDKIEGPQAEKVDEGTGIDEK